MTQPKKLESGLIVRNLPYENENNLLEKAIAILTVTGNLREIGDTGTGKNYLARAIASKLNESIKKDDDAYIFFEKGLNQDCNKWDLIGCNTLSKGETVFSAGILYKWLKAKKGILHLTGWNYAPQAALGVLETLADFTASIYIDETGEYLTRTSDHLLIISYNPSDKSGYAGTFNDNIATMRRFEGLIVPYLSKEAEIKLMLKEMPLSTKKNKTETYQFCYRMATLAANVRTLYLDGTLKSPVTTGNLQNYARLFEKTDLCESDIIDIIGTLFTEAQRDTFKSLYETEIKNSTVPDDLA
jgi:MoxR-like ATPase